MKTASAALQTLIYSNNVFAWADLYSLYFASGVQRWTTAGTNITYDGTTWTAADVVLSRPTFKTKLALEVDDIDVEFDPGALTLDGLSMKIAAARGRFDGIRFVVQRAGLDSSLVVQGVLTLFDGHVEDVTPSSTGIVLSAVSPVARLSRKTPSRVVQASCPYQVYSTPCGATPLFDSRTVAAGSTASSIVLSSSSTRAVAGSWITVTATGERKTIRSVVGATLTLAAPLSVAPSVGAAVTVTRGCDRTASTCNSVFSNLLRFGGFTMVPHGEDAA